MLKAGIYYRGNCKGMITIILKTFYGLLVLIGDYKFKVEVVLQLQNKKIIFSLAKLCAIKVLKNITFSQYNYKKNWK